MSERIAMAVVILLAFSGQSYAAGLTLVENGRTNYRIVLPEGSSPSEHRAASELNNHIRMISGATIPIVPEKTGPSILIGSKYLPKAELAELGDEGFIIRTMGEDLIIAGGRLRGTMYGVYSFLEDTLGCRWYSSEVSKIPQKKTIRIPEMNVREIPAFEYRDPYFTEAWEKNWAARNRINGFDTRLDRSTGGKIRYGRFVHTFEQLVPLSKYWDSNPEYYSLVKGERIRERTQLCLTHPDVLRISIETVMGWIDQDPDAKIFSVSANDWKNPCECDKCKAIDEEEGSPSGTLLRFVNAVAEEVGKKHPDKLIDTLAYFHTEKPCKITKPVPNVRIRLAAIGACQAHPYESCSRNEYAINNLKAWSVITDQLYIWHYNTSFPHYLIPFPDFVQLAASADMYQRHRVKGVFWQGNYSPGGGGSDAELRSWVMAKLSWNPKRDWSALVDDFLASYYGAAAPYYRQYFDMLHKEVREKNIHFTCGLNTKSELFSPEIISESVRLFDLAEKAVANQPDVLKRVQKARLAIEYVQIAQPIETKEFAGREKELLARIEPFIAACKEYGITHLNEWARIDATYEQWKKTLGG